MHQYFRYLLPLPLLLAQSSCYLYSSGKELEARLATVEARQNEFGATLTAETARLQELIASAQNTGQELQRALTEAQSFLQRTNADLGVRVDRVETQLDELRGQIEQAGFQTTQVSRELEILRQDIDLRLQNPVGR